MNTLHEVPPHHRIEEDSLGTVFVPEDVYWGAQTQRCLKTMPRGGVLSKDRMPLALIHAFGLQKAACAQTNVEFGKLDAKRAEAIIQASHEVASGALDGQFPLSIWQTGSGTQTHMNVNEVIANRAIEILGGTRGSKTPVNPNDHVNMGQSTNDSFPTVMRMSIVRQTYAKLFPALTQMHQALLKKSQQFHGVVKIARTHLQDAVPMMQSDEFNAFADQLHQSQQAIQDALTRLLPLAQGATAVGSQLNSMPQFAHHVVRHISQLTGIAFTPAHNTFSALSCHDMVVHFAGTLNVLAVALNKIANDLRILSSGPRCGIAELSLPSNEPGSSIMPGKVNPTQPEMLTMICCRIMGNYQSIAIAGAQGQLQLNAYKPIIAGLTLDMIDLLAEAMEHFTLFCIQDIQLNKDRIQHHVNHSLMLVTALNSVIGYDKSAKIAQHAFQNNISLKDAALALNLITSEEFDAHMQAEKLAQPFKK